MVQIAPDKSTDAVELRVKIPLRAMSLNNRLASSRGRLTKTREARAFDSLFDHLLRKHHAAEILSFRNEVKLDDVALEVVMRFHFPRELVISKKGKLKKTGSDVDNLIKVTLDRIAQSVGFNDGVVTRVVAEKVPSHEHAIEATIRVLPIP